MQFLDDSLHPQNQDKVVITVAPYGPEWDTLIDQHGNRMTSVQQIEQCVRIARELGREIATGQGARAIYRIGVQYRDADESLRMNGMTPNRRPGQKNVPLRA